MAPPIPVRIVSTRKNLDMKWAPESKKKVSKKRTKAIAKKILTKSQYPIRRKKFTKVDDTVLDYNPYSRSYTVVPMTTASGKVSMPGYPFAYNVGSHQSTGEAGGYTWQRHDGDINIGRSGDFDTNVYGGQPARNFDARAGMGPGLASTATSWLDRFRENISDLARARGSIVGPEDITDEYAREVLERIGKYGDKKRNEYKKLQAAKLVLAHYQENEKIKNSEK